MFPNVAFAQALERRVLWWTRGISDPLRYAVSCLHIMTPESNCSIQVDVLCGNPAKAQRELGCICSLWSFGTSYSHVAVGTPATHRSSSLSTKWSTWTFKFCSVAATLQTCLLILRTSQASFKQTYDPHAGSPSTVTIYSISSHVCSSDSAWGPRMFLNVIEVGRATFTVPNLCKK